MSGQGHGPARVVSGAIRRRLLINALADPDEAAGRLPDGLRPHVTTAGTVVGCCLLEIDGVRPARMPAIIGRRLRAAAYRISAEWEDEEGATVTGVYVSARQTDSRVAVALGGRWFPGVHELARLDVSGSATRLRWEIMPVPDENRPSLHLTVSIPRDARAHAACDPVGETCLSATVGVSSGHDGVLEAARMQPEHRETCEVVVEELDSAFISSFATAKVTTAYLMRDVGVTWTRALAPRSTATRAPR